MANIASQKTGLTIKQVAERFGLPLETLRYYDNSGLLPHLTRNHSGYRIFQAVDLSDLQMILCFRRIGVGIEDIAAVMAPTNACGDQELAQKRALLEKQRARLKKQRDQLDAALLMIAVKQAIYEDPTDSVPHALYLQREIQKFVASRCVTGAQADAAALLQTAFKTKSVGPRQDILVNELPHLISPDQRASVHEIIKLIL